VTAKRRRDGDRRAVTAIEWADATSTLAPHDLPVDREPAELRVLRLVEADARAEALTAVERAYLTLTNGGRLDVVAVDLRQALERLTTRVDRQLATASRVLGIDLRPVLVLPSPIPPAPTFHMRMTDTLVTGEAEVAR
jgi:hypothetical protein